jgi:peptidoglycan hydrolase-like protein with peptidoglycan-binding domain
MSYPFSPWEAAKNCTGNATAGAGALLAWLQANRQPPGRSLGIYNCRNVTGSSTTSLHGEGRAIDWGTPLGGDGKGTSEGRALVDLLGSNADKIGLQCIIYDRTIWSKRSPDGRPYEGVNPHYDHLHIELTWQAARELTLATVVAVLGGTGDRPPQPDAGLAFDKGQGFSTDEIKLIQRVVGTEADGLWGPLTVQEVMDWQRANGIPVDGKVWRDPRGNTWPRIQAAAASQV